MTQPFDPFAGNAQLPGSSVPGPLDLGGGAGARLFVSNKTYARLLTCEIPAPERKMLTRRPGRCSEPLDEAKSAHEAKSFLERYLSEDSWGTPKSYYWPKAFERQCLLWPDQIPEAFLDAQLQRLADHQSGRVPLHPEQSLALRRDVQLLEDIYRPGPRYEAAISGEEQAWLDARSLKFNNLLGTALLGPIFGGPAALTRAMGGTEEQIAAANDFGAVAWQSLPAAHVMRARGGSPRPLPQGGETVRGARLEPSSGGVVARHPPRTPASPIAAPAPTAQSLGIPTSINSKQDRHIPPVTDGRSVLTADPSRLLSDVHSGQARILRQPKPGQVIVDFGRPIGQYWKDGRLVGDTNFGSIMYGKNGAHIVPAGPTQW